MFIAQRNDFAPDRPHMLLGRRVLLVEERPPFLLAVSLLPVIFMYTGWSYVCFAARSASTWAASGDLPRSRARPASPDQSAIFGLGSNGRVAQIAASPNGAGTDLKPATEVRRER
jgi:hypothetical protein